MFDSRFVTVVSSPDPQVREEVEDILDSAGIGFREALPQVGCVIYPGPVGFSTPREIGEMYQSSRFRDVEIQVHRYDLDKARALIPDCYHMIA